VARELVQTVYLYQLYIFIDFICHFLLMFIDLMCVFLLLGAYKLILCAKVV